MRDTSIIDQIKAMVLLGATSGMRAEELYQLQPQDIDIENKTSENKPQPEQRTNNQDTEKQGKFFHR